MDFFAQQARVRSSTKVLVALFAVAVVAIVLAVDLCVLTVFGHHRHYYDGRPPTSSATLMFWSSAVVLAVIAMAAMYRISTLSAGGKAVAKSVGGVPVPPSTDDPQLRLLRNVIEEVSIASGTPVPDIYVMPDEPAINAFAAGYSPSDAAICVTQGCLDHLTRDELQGVIAHEFSHVLNGDMRLNIRLMGLLFGIMVLSIIGRQMTWTGNSFDTSEDAAQRRVFGYMGGFVIIIIGSIGYFFGRLIQAAVARSRETLADASAVQFTRQTAGIAGALKKIAVLDAGSELQVANRHEIAHMMFGDVDQSNAWFATHPPLLKRIHTLEPWFRESELAKVQQAMQAPQMTNAAPVTDAQDASPAKERVLPPLEWPGMAAPTADASAAAAIPAVTAAVVVAGATAASEATDATPAAAPATPSFEHASTLRKSIPVELVLAARKPESALALTLALAMSDKSELQERQRRLIANAFGDDVQFAVGKLVETEADIAPALRMPLLSLLFPSLKLLPQPRLQTLLETLNAIVNVDADVELDEYCLIRLLRMQLMEAVRPNRTPVDGVKKLIACRDSVALVCAVVAARGSEDDGAAHRAWVMAMNQIFPDTPLQWQSLPLDWQAAFDSALDDLDGLMPVGKEMLILGLISAIRADGVVTAVEAELLRVICASLHCPVPPQAIATDSVVATSPAAASMA